MDAHPRWTALACTLAFGLLAGCGAAADHPLVGGAAVPRGGSKTWLERLNQFRAWGELPPVVEDAALAEGIRNHTLYMVKNDAAGHAEVSTNAWYTASGDRAAATCNLYADPGIPADPSTSWSLPLNGWMTSPFHGLGLIHPRLSGTAFAAYQEPVGYFCYAAGLDVLTHRDGPVPSDVVRWPAPGAEIDLTTYDGDEQPDPLASCPAAWAAPTGTPVYLLLGPGRPTPIVTATSFARGGVALDHHAFDAGTYVNARDTAGEALGRATLRGVGAVVLLPRRPLQPGATYDVALDVDGSTYAWSFHVSDGAPGPRAKPGGPASVR